MNSGKGNITAVNPPIKWWRQIFAICLILIGPVDALHASNEKPTVTRQEIATIGNLDTPEHPEGLSGVFSGISGSQLVVAGGSHFPAGKPWEGGKKHFSDMITGYQRSSSGTLIPNGEIGRLPVAVGEGGSLTTPMGVIALGGETLQGLSNRVFVVQAGSGTAEVKELPALPVALKAMASVVTGQTIYVMGGEDAHGASSHFWRMDLSRAEPVWEILPDLPLSISHAMGVAQMDGEEVSIFLFGGRARYPGDSLTTFSSRVYHYRLSAGIWKERRNIGYPKHSAIALAAGVAAPVGASHIMLAGGDQGTTFNEVEKAILSMNAGNTKAMALRDSLWIHHPGFFEKVLLYNTVTDAWFEAGAFEAKPPAVLPIIVWGNSYLLVGGELRPGIRLPEIREIRFSVQPLFGWINYVVLGVYFIGMVLLGFFFMKREGNTDDFFKAGGRIPWWAAGISIFATTLSAITFIAIPAKSYASDWRMLTFNLTIVLIAPVVIRYFLPFFRRLNLNTAYHYLDIRFDRWVRWLASSLFILFMISRISIVLFLPSLALNAVTGFSVYWAVIIMGVVTIIYCTSGGIEAVVWGDVIQGFILLGGAFFALVFMLSGVDGGLGGFIEIASEQQKFKSFDFRFSLSEPVFWVVLIGGVSNTLISYTSDQSVVQRYMTTRDEKATARSLWLNGILSVPVSIVFFLLGTALFAFYTSNPDRMAVVNPNIDSVFPQFIVAQMPAGLAGLLIAAIFAAAMSTLSSNINSVAAVVTSDFYSIFFKNSSVKHHMTVARSSGILAGVLGIGLALVLATWNIASLWDQFNTFLGLLTGGLGALFIMGIFFPKISGRAALIGVLAGVFMLVVIRQYTDVSFLLYGFAGISLSIVAAWLVSLRYPNQKSIDGYTCLSKKP